MKKIYSPQTAKTLTQLCTLKTDNYDCRGYWIITDELNVSIARQKLGHPAEETISIPKTTFDRMIKWYQTPTLGKAVAMRKAT